MFPARSRSIVCRYICCTSGDHARRKSTPFSFPVSNSTMAAGAESLSFDASTAGETVAMMNVSPSSIITPRVLLHLFLQLCQAVRQFRRTGQSTQAARHHLQGKVRLPQAEVRVDEREIGRHERRITENRASP